MAKVPSAPPQTVSEASNSAAASLLTFTVPLERAVTGHYQFLKTAYSCKELHNDDVIRIAIMRYVLYLLSIEPNL